MLIHCGRRGVEVGRGEKVRQQGIGLYGREEGREGGRKRGKGKGGNGIKQCQLLQLLQLGAMEIQGWQCECSVSLSQPAGQLSSGLYSLEYRKKSNSSQCTSTDSGTIITSMVWFAQPRLKGREEKLYV